MLIKAFTWFQRLLSHTTIFFFFFRNLVSLSKHCSFFQPVKKLKWCFLPPKLTTEEPKQCLGKEAERSPFFQFQIQQKWCAVLTDLHALLPTARPDYLPCLGAALYTPQGFWFCVCVCVCVCVHVCAHSLSHVWPDFLWPLRL